MHTETLEPHLKGVLGVRSRRDAVRVLADRIARGNRARQCRRLHTLIETGQGATELIDAVRQASGSEVRAFDAALAETRLAVRARQDTDKHARRILQQATVGAHVWVEHARRRPSQITIVAMTGLGRWKRVRLPAGIEHRDWQEQLASVAEACQRWLQERGPRCPLFGTVTGFMYRPTPWSSYRFSVTGGLCSGDLGPWSEPRAEWAPR